MPEKRREIKIGFPVKKFVPIKGQGSRTIPQLAKTQENVRKALAKKAAKK